MIDTESLGELWDVDEMNAERAGNGIFHVEEWWENWEMKTKAICSYNKNTTLSRIDGLNSILRLGL